MTVFTVTSQGISLFHFQDKVVFAKLNLCEKRVGGNGEEN